MKTENSEERKPKKKTKKLKLTHTLVSCIWLQMNVWLQNLIGIERQRKSNRQKKFLLKIIQNWLVFQFVTSYHFVPIDCCLY